MISIPYRDNPKIKKIVNLLLYSNGETNQYVVITNMRRALRLLITKDNHKYAICYRCLKPCKTIEDLKEHLELCSDHDAVRVVMPEGKDGKRPYYGFKNFHKQLMALIVAYFDFTSFLRQIRSDRVYDDTRSYTEKYQQNIPSGFSMIFKITDDNVFKPELHQYTAESESVDVSKIFVDMLQYSVKRIWSTV